MATITPPTEKKPALTTQPVLTPQQDAMRLIRVRVTNFDPKKKDMTGDWYTFANDVVGTVRKFVPYGEQSDDGYHIPNCIYEMLCEKEFQSVRVTKQADGKDRIESKWVKEFAFEVLPPLTKQELADLATAQAAAGIQD